MSKKCTPQPDPDFAIHHPERMRSEHFVILAEPRQVKAERKADKPRRSQHKKNVEAAAFVVDLPRKRH